MHFDVRYPIGGLLATYGALLALHGLTVGTQVVGLNVNLYWGTFMLACGVGALTLARRRRRRPRVPTEPGA